MDAQIADAARALSVGDPLGALNRVALRDDAHSLALRGIAMAQLGDLALARGLLRRAGRAFGPHDVLARARCAVAEAEVALASRDLLGRSTEALGPARAALEAHGDRANAAYARHLEGRRLLLVGRVDEAERAVAELDPAALPPPARTAHELVVAGIAIRSLHTRAARAALDRAARAARRARIPALTAEVESALRVLSSPAARLSERGEERLLRLEEVERLLASDTLVVDACRQAVYDGRRQQVSLTTRPVLLALARALGEAWPGDVPRDALVARAFGSKYLDESHRARLRVEIGRLRRMLGGLAHVSATTRGFKLEPQRAHEAVVLVWAVADEQAAVLAFLADGESWSWSVNALSL